MFNWTTPPTFPKITDIFNYSDLTHINWMDMFTYLWIHFLGNWFYGVVVGVIGAAIFVKYDNPIVVVGYFIVAAVLLGRVLPSPMLMIIGILSGIAIGILFYQVFVGKRG